MEAKVDHVAIAVPDLGAAWRLFGRVLGGEFVAGGDDTEIGIRAIQLSFPPGVKVELIQPLDPGSYLQAFLDRRGPGFHHLTVRVDDVVDTDATLRDRGFETTDLDLHDPRWRETYIRPRSAFGTLVQISDSTVDLSAGGDPVTPEQVIAGEVLWVGAAPPRLRTAADDPPGAGPASEPQRFSR